MSASGWWLFPTAAGLVSSAFAYSLARQWAVRHRPHVLAWTVALAMFAVASMVAGVSMLVRWTPDSFRLYYLFGAIANVPVLALGTVYLLAPRKVAHVCALLVAGACIVAAVVVIGANLERARLDVVGIPSARDVVSERVRTLSRYYSFTGFFVVVAGALWSAWRLARNREAGLRRLALANVLIAAGTFLVAVGSGFARYGRGVPFALGLLIGVSVMFVGFLMTRTPRPTVG